MLFKWITHQFCSSRLESRSRAVRSRIMTLEAERKEVDKRIRYESEQLQYNLEDLVAQRQAELQETVTFLNRYLSLCQDTVQALQKYTEQAYATVDTWLQSQVQWSTYNSVKQRIELLKEQDIFLQEADKAYRVLSDLPKRRKWCTAQPEIAFAANSRVQACAGALKERRKTIIKRNCTINAILKRIGSQRKWILTELQKAYSDYKTARSEMETFRSTHQEQRDAMKEALRHTIDLWKKLKIQIDAWNQEQREQLRIRFLECRKELVLAKKAVNLVHEEEDYDNLEAKKEARSRAFQRHEDAFAEWRACCDQIKKDKSILRQYWCKLSPHEHRGSIEAHVDVFLQNPERRRQAIGGGAP